LTGKYFWHRFFSSQPDLNYDNPAVHEEMIKIMRYWLDLGVDGFRADAVPYLYEREGTNCENLPETHVFLKKVRRIMDEEYPGRILIAEANQWPEDVRAYFGDGDEFHMCFHFPIMPRLYMALKRADKSSILEILDRTPEIPANAQWLTFLRNHDELTLEMVTPEERQWMWEQYAPEPRMRQNLGIRRRLSPLLEGDKRRWLLLNALLLSLPGTPIVYYGDEIGMGDNINLPDRHGCRTAMQWDGSKNGGFSPADETYFPANSDDIYGFQHINVAAQENDPESRLWAMRFLLQARRNQAALRGGRMEMIAVDNPAILAYWRIAESEAGKERLLCLYNLSYQQQSIALELSGEKGHSLVDLLANEQRLIITEWPVVLNLKAYASHWYRLES
jgi:maltose alpha-D-glucosyltransferase/alpha-amylase